MKHRYDGGCHCGAVRYMVSADLSGEDNLSEYRFNQKVIAHLFCSTCGVEPYAFGKDKMGNPMVAINVRTLDAVDITNLKIAPFDGLHLL